jgi:hypothetical protein
VLTKLTPNQQAHWLRVILVFTLCAAFALRLHELTLQDIWWDEARNIDVALRPFTQIATAPELDIQPPLYFWLLHLWGRLTGLHLGDDPVRIAFLARFVSVGAGLAATALVYLLGRRSYSPVAGLFAALLAAFSPFWLAESQETRMYTAGFALLAAGALALLRMVDHQSLAAEPATSLHHPITPSPHHRLISPKRYAALFVLLSVCALLTHYNALFILAAWYLWWGGWALLQPQPWKRLRILLLCGLATSVLFAPMLRIALQQIAPYANPNLTVPTIVEYLVQSWRAYLGGYAFDPAMLGGNGERWLWAALAITLGGLAVGAIHLAGNRTSHRKTHEGGERHSLMPGLTSSALENAPSTKISCMLHASFLLVWVFVSLALYYIAVLDRGAFNVRYSSFITPALYVLVGGALSAWGRLWRPLPGVALLLFAAGLLPGLRADLYDPRFAREDIAGVTNWLRQVAGPKDIILVDQKYPFGFYYQRFTIDPAITPQGREPAPARYLFVDINTLDQRLNGWAQTASHVFWVQWFESDTDPRHAVPFLLGKAGRLAGTQTFQGYVVDWWALNPPNHFEIAPAWTPMRLVFPTAVETVAISLPEEPLAPGNRIPVVIRWQRRGPSGRGGTVDRPLKARVALYDGGGGRLAQSDERILNDRHVTPAMWEMTEQPLNVYLLETPEDLPGGAYTVRLLVYEEETLEPLPLADAAGNPTGQEAALGTVEIR